MRRVFYSYFIQKGVTILLQIDRIDHNRKDHGAHDKAEHHYRIHELLEPELGAHDILYHVLKIEMRAYNPGQIVDHECQLLLLGTLVPTTLSLLLLLLVVVLSHTGRRLVVDCLADFEDHFLGGVDHGLHYY